MKIILLSLHKKWWGKMLTGEKVLEIRKTKPATEEPCRVLVYITGGVGIVGHFLCEKRIKIREMQEEEQQKRSCLTEKQLKEYTGDGGKTVWGWTVSEVEEYKEPIPIDKLGIKRAPQSWQYVKIKEE